MGNKGPKVLKMAYLYDTVPHSDPGQLGLGKKGPTTSWVGTTSRPLQAQLLPIYVTRCWSALLQAPEYPALSRDGQYLHGDTFIVQNHVFSIYSDLLLFRFFNAVPAERGKAHLQTIWRNLEEST